MLRSMLKTKKFYIIAGLILLIVYVGYKQYQKARPVSNYETVKVESGNLIQTVEATGNVESENDLALRFDVLGTVETIKVKEGEAVKKGEILANLRLADLNAAVAQAKANLDQKLAGATSEDRAYYAAAVDSAKASYDQSKVDAENAVKTAQAAVATALNNLNLAEGGENSKIVTQAYQSVLATLYSTVSKLDDALTQADNILGIDNILGNATFKSYLANLNPNSLTTANGLYTKAKNAKADFKGQTLSLTVASDHPSIDATLKNAESVLTAMSDLLSAVSSVLSATLPVDVLTQTSLDAKKTTIEASRTAINTQYNNIIIQQQALDDAKNSYSNYNIKYNNALRDLEQAKANAKNSVKIKEAAYNQALANYNSKINPPREVDVAALRAALSQAAANRDKAIIRSPINGVITFVKKKVGESVSSGEAVVQLLAPHYEIKVDIAETDVSKLVVGQPAYITLDAFGEDVKFGGLISAIDPASTIVQDVVYYKVTISLNESDKPVKAGMTANVTINTANRVNALFIPLRTVHVKDDGTKYVRLLINGQKQEQAVQVGLKANDGRVEILSGLTIGQEVVVSVKE